MALPLAVGIYEHLVTRLLEREIASAAPAVGELAAIGDADLPGWLSRLFARELEGALRGAKTEDARLAITHALLERLAELAPKHRISEDTQVAPPARTLLALREPHRRPPLRPQSPLTASTILTHARGEPALGHELSREIASADSIDIIAAFITMPGVRVVRDELRLAAQRGARIRCSLPCSPAQRR